VEVPAVKAVITPELSTVATEGFELVYVIAPPLGMLEVTAFVNEPVNMTDAVFCVANVNVGVGVVLTVILTAADVAASYIPFAALVAVTVQVPALAGAVKVVPETVQLPLATAYVTAPAPLPPELLNVVVPFVLMVVAAGIAVSVACVASDTTME